MTDERTCAEVLVADYDFGRLIAGQTQQSTFYGKARAVLATLHPDLPDMPIDTLRRYITLCKGEQ